MLEHLPYSYTAKEFTNETDLSFYNPFYDHGLGILTFIGGMFQTFDWDGIGPWLLVIPLSPFISLAGIFLFPPFILCLLFTDDLNNCSYGIWGNAWKDHDSKCYAKFDWKHAKLTDDQVNCYYNRYKNDALKAFNGQNLCDLRIEWDTFGKAANRNASC